MEVTLDLMRDNGEALSVSAEGLTAYEAGLAALTEAYGIDAKVIDCEITQSGFSFDTGAFAEIALQIKGVGYRGRGRGPDPVWAGLRALCDAFEKSVFLAPAKGRTEIANTKLSKIAEKTS